jgi:hypothetical protein
MSRAAYLADLADLIDKARELADRLDLDGTGYGDGYALEATFADGTSVFGYGNTSDLLSDLGAEIREAADALKAAA